MGMARNVASALKVALALLFIVAALMNAKPSIGQPYEFFCITVDPSTVTIKAGENTTISYRVEPVGGYNETVNLSAEEVSDELTVVISPSNGTPSFNGTVSISVGSLAGEKYTFKVKGTGADGLTNTATVIVQVPHFELSVDEEVLIALNGSQVSTEVYVKSVYGYNETVTLSVSGVPSKVSAVFSPNKGTPPFTSNLKLTVDGDASLSTCWLTVKAEGKDGKEKTVKIEFAVAFVGVEAVRQPVFDLRGHQRGNLDGTYYPGDAFHIKYEVSTENVNFSHVEFAYEDSVFNGPKIAQLKTGAVLFDVKKTASPGDYEVRVKTVVTYTSIDGKEVRVEAVSEVPVEVVEYDPHFTVLIVYTIPNSTGNDAYEKPFAVIVRYEGNGPERKLTQRAVIEGFEWDGYASKMSGEFLTPGTTNYTGFFSTVGGVTFSAVGFEGDAYGTVLTVDGVTYDVWDLPRTFIWESGSNHTYAWERKVDVSIGGYGGPGEPAYIDPNQGFEWRNTLVFPPQLKDLTPETFNASYESLISKFSSAPEGNLTVSPFGNSVTALYTRCKLLEAFTVEIGKSREETVVSLTEYPVFFDNSSRYFKFKFDLYDEVMREALRQGYNSSAYVEIHFKSEMFLPGPKTVLTANYTCPHAVHRKPVRIEACKWNRTEEIWETDYTVKIEATFDTAFNFTEKDVMKTLFGMQTSDDEALRLADEDLQECPPQSFVGYGVAEGMLNRISPYYYNLNVTAGDVTMKRTVSIDFSNNETYVMFVNLDPSSPLNVTVARDSFKDTTLLLTAPPQLGGLANIFIYVVTEAPTGYSLGDVTVDKLKLELLKKENLILPQTGVEWTGGYELYRGYTPIYQNTLGFQGQHEVYVQKKPDMPILPGYDKVLLFIAAENVWGTEFHTLVEVIPYTRTAIEVTLEEAALYVFWLVAAAIIFSLVVYLIKGGR